MKLDFAHRNKPKCTPGGVYLLHIMGWSIEDIAKGYGRSEESIEAKLYTAKLWPKGKRNKKRAAPRWTDDL